MTALQLVDEAARRGLTLKPAGVDKLAVVPARLCTPEFAERLREHKPELLSLLSLGNQGSPQEVVTPHRPLSERERALLVHWCGTDNHPLIIDAINLFNATIISIIDPDGQEWFL